MINVPRILLDSTRNLTGVRAEPISLRLGSRRRGSGLAVLAANVAEAAIASAAPPSADLNLPIEKQLKREWCWAAIGASLGRHLGTRVIAQCELAAEITGDDCCPAIPDDPAGDVPKFLRDVLNRVNLSPVNASPLGPVPPSKLRTELGVRGRPVPIQIRWNDSDAAHYVYLDGYQTDDSSADPILFVRDPIDGSRRPMPYNMVRSAFVHVSTGAVGTWFETFLI